MTHASRIVRRRIDPAALVSEVSRAANGAVLVFVGIVRDVNDGRRVTGIEYSAYEAMAARELDAIVVECAERFGCDVSVEHRLGELALQEASVAIAVGHPHRGAAYDASRWVIEELKRRVPIWKREHYMDGRREWVDPSGQPGAAQLIDAGVDAAAR